MNPYPKKLDLNEIQDEANKQWNNGFKVSQIIYEGGGLFQVLFIMKTAEATAERSTAGGAP